jgi:hypothetical protein
MKPFGTNKILGFNAVFNKISRQDEFVAGHNPTVETDAIHAMEFIDRFFSLNNTQETRFSHICTCF